MKKSNMILILSVILFSFINIGLVQAGCVTIKVQYQDSCPRYDASVRKIWPSPTIGLGTTNEIGIVESCDVLGPGSYQVDAWYESSKFGGNTGLEVDEYGNGQTIITKYSDYPQGTESCGSGSCISHKYCYNDNPPYVQCGSWNTLCNPSWKCSDSIFGGDNNYGAFDFLRPSQGYCDGSGNCDWSLTSGSTCTRFNLTGQEGPGINYCKDDVSSCLGTCIDGLDNDNNGCIDSADYQCGGTEIVDNGIDDNCDGQELCYQDLDNDNYRPDSTATVVSSDMDCLDSGEARSTDPTGDCNDMSAAIHPGAIEIPADGIDQNCDSDELCYKDLDNDGYRPDSFSTVLSDDMDCNDPGEAITSDPIGDCNDNDASIHPGATEIADDGIDSNCDGKELCYKDSDNDNYRPDASSTVISNDLDCIDSGEARSTDPTGDCDDSNAAIHPGATEIPADGIDQNCDSDELCYKDLDNDGYRPDSFSTVVSDDLDCTDTGEAISTDPTGDCNDADASIHPGAVEICNGLDDNCDAIIDGISQSCGSGPCTGNKICTAGSWGDCSSSGNSCDDGLYCNVGENCNANGQCSGGSQRDCSENNILGIETCDNNPDNIHFTLDSRNPFTSICNETIDSCPTGDDTITHTCSKSQCGAQCDQNSDCGTGRTCKSDCTCTADITPPTITTLSPQNATYYSNSTPLTFTINEQTSLIKYNLDGINYTITGNTVITGLINGTHSVIVYAKDTSGNEGSSNKIYFTNKLGVYNPWETSYIGTGGYPIIDIEQYNGKLYFAANNNNIYVFNITSWSQIQAPTSVLSIQNYTYGKMYVTGSGGKIYSFDGSNFNQVFDTQSQYSKMLGVYNSRLYAATYLASPAKLYYYDGSWHEDTAFSSILVCPAPFCSIDSMVVNGTKIYVGSGGKIYSYDGSSWNIIKDYSDVYAYQDMKVYNNKLYLATRDQSTRCPYPQGNGFCGRVIEYDGTNWNTKFDYNYWMYSLEVYNGRLYAGTANKIYMYDGNNWQLTFNSLEEAQYALVLKAWNNRIYVGFGNGIMFKDDMLEPTIITITSPKSITYTKTYVPLTYTVSKPISWIGYSLDNKPNKTITGPVNLTSLSNGQRSLKLYATDTYGKTTSASVSFFYCLGDINGDRKIDMRDVSAISNLYGSSCGSSKYNNSADLNNDCKIDLLDVIIVSGQFGKTC